MKIVFIGTVDFSYQALQALITNEFNIVGVITKKKSNFNADFCDLTPLTEKHHIPTCFKKKDNEEEIISFLKELNPDVIYCFGWSHILPAEILSIPKYGVVEVKKTRSAPISLIPPIFINSRLPHRAATEKPLAIPLPKVQRSGSTL